jgi:exodeoxyribonuclease VII large subunit
MARLPFDPNEIEGPEPSGPPARREQKRYASTIEAKQLTVTQVSELIRTTLEAIPSPLRVVGEISNLSAQSHWYFSLKDEGAVLSCVAWASSARKFGFTPGNGDEVVATGHLSHYGPQGRTQLYVSDVKPVGAGALDLKFKALCEELRKLGYFDAARKKPLPVLPRRIAVITASQSAAWADVEKTASQRCCAVKLLLVDVRVQGEGSAEQVAGAIRGVDEHKEKLGVDAILVTRGGGSKEDLWAFNERIVADAVFTCSLPVVAAIGHESDTTIIELVADLRASTPTQAIMRLIPSAEDLTRQLTHLGKRLGLLIMRSIEAAQERAAQLIRHLRQSTAAAMHVRNMTLERLAGRLEKVRPIALVAQRRERLAVLVDRLSRAVGQRLGQREVLDRFAIELNRAMETRLALEHQRLDGGQRMLAAIDPAQVLRRGFSITQRADGAVVRSVNDVSVGNRIVTRVADGSLQSEVTGSAGRAHAKPARGLKRARSTKRRPSGDGDQLDLFRG